MKQIQFIVIALLGVLVLSACGAQDAENAAEPVKFTIDMTEFAYAPNELEVKVGQEVTIELINSGALEHELMIGRDVIKENNRPKGFTHDLFETAQVEPMVMGAAMEDMSDDGQEDDGHGEEHSGFMVAIPAGGENASINFTVTEEMVGEWEIGCFEQDGVHYDAGMIGKLTVLP